MPYLNCRLPEYPCREDVWDRLAREARPIVVYGMGNGADKLIKRFEKYNIEISDFFASDGFVRGHSFHGKRVKSFSEIREEYENFVIVLSFASNRDDVIDMLSEIDKEYEMLVPDMPVAGEDEYFDREFYNANYGEIKRAYDVLADEESKNAYSAVINYRLSGKMSYLVNAFSKKEEIYSFFEKREKNVAVDVGAYNGDTVREELQFFPSLSKIYAIEPDPKNFKRLKKYTDGIAFPQIVSINAAAWSECSGGSFLSAGNRNSSVSSTASFEHKVNSVDLMSLDSLIDERIDYIKYDVEGAEYEALLGSHRLISEYKPDMLVSLYHRSRDIFYLVNLLSEKYPTYNFYIRRLRCIPAWEIDLLMIPKARDT